MKKDYLKVSGCIAMFLMVFWAYGQDIHFTFDNAQNTTDGTNEYYEIDVMIQTINNTGNFKLGSGQLYFTYNTNAFGENVNFNTNFEVIDINTNYVIGQYAEGGTTNIYGALISNDNTSNRVSWAFSQNIGASSFSNDNITDVPSKLCRLRFKYINSSEAPNLNFEEGSIYRKQFYTACGPTSGSGLEIADCINHSGVQIVNDSFDSLGATLSTEEFLFAGTEGYILYPNPTNDVLKIKGDSSKLAKIGVYDILGKEVLSKEKGIKEIDITSLPSAFYIVKLTTNKATYSYKILKK
ncbi:MAG: T9SS type A sorting domain-containing protein [Jejuia sp.]